MPVVPEVSEYYAAAFRIDRQEVVPVVCAVVAVPAMPSAIVLVVLHVSSHPNRTSNTRMMKRNCSQRDSVVSWRTACCHMSDMARRATRWDIESTAVFEWSTDVWCRSVLLDSLRMVRLWMPFLSMMVLAKTNTALRN